MDLNNCKCWGVKAAGLPLEPCVIARRAPTVNDIVIEMKYCGICHSDIHTVRGEWGPLNVSPLVPGHELVGIVSAVGSNVTKFAVGDRVGVGCMVDSCRKCNFCAISQQQYCSSGAVFTYNANFKYPHCAEYNAEGGNPTYGGYTQSFVIDESYALKIPSNLDLAAVAPMLCAGITVYSPMVHFGLKEGMRFGVVGLGGLGHVAVKFGLAMGCHVSVISRGNTKKADALESLKANAYIDSTNEDEMKAAAMSMDFIICTISAEYNLTSYVNLLGSQGKFIVVGVAPSELPISLMPLIFTRKTIAGSLIGGIEETQAMLDFCGIHNILCDIEVISADQLNEAYDRVVKADVKYRAVIDMTKA